MIMKSIFFITVGALGTLAALNLHFVAYDGGATVLVKESMTLDETIVDARDWGPFEHLTHAAPIRGFINDRLINDPVGHMGLKP